MVPTIERNAPVLAPLLEKRIALAHPLGRRTAAPIEVEFIALEKHIAGMPADADGHIAHQFHSARIRMLAQRLPLAVAQPLHEGEKPEPVINHRRIAPPQIVHIIAGLARHLAGLRPLVPGQRLAVMLHQKAEQAVIVQPLTLLPFEAREVLFKAFPRLIEFRPRQLQQRAFRLADRRVVEPFRIQRVAETFADSRNIRRRQPWQPCFVDGQVNRIQRGGGNRAVGALVGAVFIDRQQLDERHAMVRRPIDPLLERLSVSDAEIALAAG